MMHFHWYCPICRKALGINSSARDYAKIWRGPEYEYTHHTNGQMHVLELVDAQDIHPERGLVVVFVNGREEVCPWMPFGKH